MPISEKQRLFREAMSRLTGPVNLLTTDGPAGKYGMVASAVCSVTDTPPTLLVCINRKSFAHDKFVANGVFTVNVLTGSHQELSNVFSRYVEGVDRFSYGNWYTSKTGSPAVQDANVVCDCLIVGREEIGTHSVIFGEVQDVTLSEGSNDALVWFRRGYHRIEEK